MEVIQEITSDLEDLHKNISDQATNHIHAGEVILAYGRSRTVELVRTSIQLFTKHMILYNSYIPPLCHTSSLVFEGSCCQEVAIHCGGL